jgi:hypothetical protein
VVVALSLGVIQSDVVRLLGGVKGDEATYVSMAYSLAYDADLKFTRGDLDRFYSVYQSGPSGIFLKQGTNVGISWRGLRPHIRHSERRPDAGLDYGKAFLYPVFAAPFVRVFGLSGLLLLNVLLFAGVVWVAVAFVWARNGGLSATGMAIAFVLATIVPVYVVWLTPEMLNFALVFFAYALWLYKRQPAAAGPAWLLGPASDILAAVLLGLATYSKPPNALLVAPMGLMLLKQRQFKVLAALTLAFAVASGGAFALNGLISGDVSYQGGRRRSFGDRFPFSTPDATFASVGNPMATDDSDAGSLLAPQTMWPLLRHNTVYFFFGRHAGLVPFYFPGAMALVLWAARRRFRDLTSALIMGALAVSVLVLLVLTPYSWAGGGGPPGNRYFLSLYPVLFFVLPAVRPWEAALAWAGGMAFVAPLLLNPFTTSRFVWQAMNTPALRLLPIELTMVDDLPVRLNESRSRIPFGKDPEVLLYFLDPDAPTPEGRGVWVPGARTEDIVVRNERPLSGVGITWQSPVAMQVSASIGGRSITMRVEPGQKVSTWLGAGSGVVYTRGSMAYVLRLSAGSGFVPKEIDPASTDGRFLGAFAELTFRE